MIALASSRVLIWLRVVEGLPTIRMNDEDVRLSYGRPSCDCVLHRPTPQNPFVDPKPSATFMGISC